MPIDITTALLVLLAAQVAHYWVYWVMTGRELAGLRARVEELEG